MHSDQHIDQIYTKIMGSTSIFTRKRKKIPVHSVRNGEPFQWSKVKPLVTPIKDYLQGLPIDLRLIASINYDVTKAHY